MDHGIDWTEKSAHVGLDTSAEHVITLLFAKTKATIGIPFNPVITMMLLEITHVQKPRYQCNDVFDRRRGRRRADSGPSARRMCSSLPMSTICFVCSLLRSRASQKGCDSRAQQETHSYTGAFANMWHNGFCMFEPAAYLTSHFLVKNKWLICAQTHARQFFDLSNTKNDHESNPTNMMRHDEHRENCG